MCSSDLLALLELQAAQEREYLNGLRYTLLPTLPRVTRGGRYSLSLVVSADGQHYRATAAPVPRTSAANWRETFRSPAAPWALISNTNRRVSQAGLDSSARTLSR